MNTFDWTTAIAECATHLAGLGKLPPPDAQHSALQAIAVLSLIADAKIDHALTPASTIPTLAIPRYAGRHDLVDELLGQLTLALAAPCRGSRHAFSPTDWLDEYGLDELVLRSVQHTADDPGRGALLAYAARKAHDLGKAQERLRHEHMRALLARDTPDLDADWRHFPLNLLAWILAHEYDNNPTRTLRVQRRLQALRLYASLADRLYEPAITAVIDAGRELVPALTKRLALTRAQLQALRQATPPGHFASYQRHNFEYAVRHLQAHTVPLHQWPGGGRPGQHAAWQSSRWLTTDEFTLIPANYYADDATTVRDAVRAFSDDLLAPLLADLKSPNAGVILHSAKFLTLDTLPKHLPAAQQFLASIRRALIGDRGPKAFQEAAQVWHRRAAAVAALRNENQTDRPGWPPLCPPWTSCCGKFEILPLTTAKALVEEGNAHHHCVGTYYDACRSGGTQILSLRQNGKPTVTAEILLDARIASLRVAQFKGLYDEVPDDPALHQAMRDFLRDIRTAVHPLNRKELCAYRQWADEHVYAWSQRPLSLAHAREAFPLYLALLPRRAPSDFDQWCDATGLTDGLRTALRLLAKDAQLSD
jgi:hypothetical protein